MSARSVECWQPPRVAADASAISHQPGRLRSPLSRILSKLHGREQPRSSTIHDCGAIREMTTQRLACQRPTASYYGQKRGISGLVSPHTESAFTNLASSSGLYLWKCPLYPW